ncbi:bifunctional indole-3-glycerol-phosphate synthase TrpC/phosphoribosylanthranilate isomerase TrpF [Corynebacterium mendelii]|uniref:N-(5'-phosphoribosyl)anthranilate isomerase n=1 Tax=Corynebacterium mendelii TaxID=2765362 RepID=A0A939DZZ0_9CORY|nr:bifunctional indole-3-glycerol-phosphate synthase TrpC/phosphoribosylanthranilate isomerase TrpF [Corynebacterium mendelii]MBN9644380.1 bifunctional indole-3-glycerol-phosphate synthase TrpC/phosphoribosylanthranilate isomerase TrpF [Corynebacterium mendelii]
MPTVLEGIVTKRRGHLDSIRRRISGLDPQTLPVSTRSLYDSLCHRQPYSPQRDPQSDETQSSPLPRGNKRFIMECKSASPSLGMIREHYQPGDIARIYSRYAAGISVLCEPERFGGDYDHLATVAQSTHLPVLCKDFIIDECQLHAARYFGADAVLLMLSVLDDDDYARLAQEATRLGLDILTEVVDDGEMERARAHGARIIGINHRNLHDLSIDLSRSGQLAPSAPLDAVVIAESGIRDHATVTRLAGPVNGFLVGSQLTGEPDIDLAARRLVFGDNKVCGLKTARAAQAARAAGAVYGGLILDENSPRTVTADEAVGIINAEPGLKYVAVSRHEQDWGRLALAGVHAVQVHEPVGSIEQERQLARKVTAEIAGEAGSPRYWRALSMTTDGAGAVAEMLIDEDLVDMLVLDSGRGGTGTSFDWTRIPDKIKQRSLLAGGLTLDNLDDALRVGCGGVDLNSGLEYGPSAGTWAHHKDAGKIAEAFGRIRAFID